MSETTPSSSSNNTEKKEGKVGNDLTRLIAKERPKLKDIDIDSDDLEAQRLLKKLEAERYGADTNDRKWLSKWAAITVSIWLGLVMGILALNNFWLKLSDGVLIMLLGTTTLNVLGLPIIVLRNLFPSINNPKR